MTTPYSLQGTFVYPPDDGQPNATRSFSQSGNFDHKSEKEYLLTGAGSQSVDLGSIPFVKAAVIEVDSTALAPIIVTVNGGTDQVEISPGGFFVYSNPNPVAGLTQLDLAYTMNARVQVYLLG